MRGFSDRCSQSVSGKSVEHHVLLVKLCRTVRPNAQSGQTIAKNYGTIVNTYLSGGRGVTKVIVNGPVFERAAN